MNGPGDTLAMCDVPNVVSATIGTDPSIPPQVRDAYLQEHARNVLAEHRRVADLLLQRLLVDGMPEGIQLSDIEALCAVVSTPRGRSPPLMRKIVIEFLLVLRQG